MCVCMCAFVFPLRLTGIHLHGRYLILFPNFRSCCRSLLFMLSIILIRFSLWSWLPVIYEIRFFVVFVVVAYALCTHSVHIFALRLHRITSPYMSILVEATRNRRRRRHRHRIVMLWQIVHLCFGTFNLILYFSLRCFLLHIALVLCSQWCAVCNVYSEFSFE